MERAMRLTIEIATATLLIFCISATSAAFAAGKAGRSADGLSCSFSVPANASPAARCAAIRRQCGGNSTPITAATSCSRRCERITNRQLRRRLKRSSD